MNLVLPKFGRGEGLGNRLFPFARAFVYAKQHNLQLLRPIFENIKYKTFQMGGIAYSTSVRKILLVDNFNFREPEYLGLIPSIHKNLTWKHTSEPDNLLAKCNDDNCIIEFASKRTFDTIEPYRQQIRDEIYRITKPKWHKLISKVNGFPIAMNIRMGNDFMGEQMKYGYFKYTSIQHPLIWYKKTLNMIREIKGYNVPAMIITDGTASQLKLLLDMPNVYFIQTPAVISDLLVLAKAKLLLCSGASTFSCWASFLEKLPTISFPGQHPNMQKLSSNLLQHFVGEFDPLEPDAGTIQFFQELDLA